MTDRAADASLPDDASIVPSDATAGALCHLGPERAGVERGPRPLPASASRVPREPRGAPWASPPTPHSAPDDGAGAAAGSTQRHGARAALRPIRGVGRTRPCIGPFSVSPSASPPPLPASAPSIARSWLRVRARPRPVSPDPARVLERGRGGPWFGKVAVARSSRTRMTFQLAHAMEPGTARQAEPDPLTR